ncbi:hypothetical protein CTheo_8262 [Ceratobasidium theobromae]|uniref:F-box domain-containing protein n=1 Tax=Ceratobasidium theobromae TaxID=1582974 RepID=A0A5N5QA30_9AGAM|nr:hypothetical protein CTheo_8262 [Ceratobasidium theobromae]
MSAATKVLFTPELLHTICDFTDQSSCARLSRVCRRAFRLLVSLVWKHVDGAQNLLILIKFVVPIYDAKSGSLVSIDFDSQIARSRSSADSFERFDLYAPYVKTLDIYGRSSHFYFLNRDNIPILRRMLKRRGSRALLPNLHSFDLTSDQRRHSHGDLKLDRMYWIKLLGSDKIETVMLRSDGPPNYDFLIGYGQASSIVRYLAKHCPNVQTLSLYPREDIASSPRNLSLFINPWYIGIQELNKLKSLLLSDGWLSDQPILGLGNLPELTSLEFEPGDLYTKWPENTSSVELNEFLSPTAFPKLDTLKLDIKLTYQIFVLGLQKMVKHVENLNLYTGLFMDAVEPEDLEAINSDFEESKDLLQHKLVPLFANMPNLKHLELTMWSPHSHIDETLSVEFPGFLDAVILPQLEFVAFDGLHFGSRTLERNLASVWPQLTTLLLPDQDASLQELAGFATLPNLFNLMVRLKITTKYPFKPISRTEYAPLERIDCCKGTEISSEPEVLNHTARAPFLDATDKLNTFLSAFAESDWNCEHFEA